MFSRYIFDNDTTYKNLLALTGIDLFTKLYPYNS